MSDLYGELGVSKKATDAEIVRAYRKKSLVLHPDRGGDPEAFARLAAAYATLHDAKARKHYDRTGEARGGISEKDRIDRAATSQLCGLFSEVVRKNSQHRLIHCDVIGKVAEIIERRREECVKARLKAGNEINKIKDVRRRMKFKKKRVARGSDLFGGVLADVEEELKRELARHEENKKILTRMLDLLVGYTFEQDKRAGTTWTMSTDVRIVFGDATQG